MKPTLTALGTAVPAHRIAQDRVIDFMTHMMDVPPEEHRKLRIIYRASGIDSRYSVLEDYTRTSGFTFFPNDAQTPFPSTAQRMAAYEAAATPLALAAIRDALPPDFDYTTITHLITFSCTGMYAPGLDLDLVAALGLQHVSRTCINFMGCYAAFNALKVAHAFAQSQPQARVLLVGVELCTLHFQRINNYDHIVANSIFGDGAAAALIEREPHTTGGLSLDAFHHAVVPDGASEMAWRIQDTGFHMQLTSYVPALLHTNLSAAFAEWYAALGLAPDASLHYAIHPGGRKIIEAVQRALQLTPADLSASYDTLRRYGNMSSVSVLFVLKQLLADGWEPGERALAMAFGPGLTVEAATFTRL